MKKVIGLFLIGLVVSSFAFSETIALKSGKKVEGKIIERTDEYIRIDFHDVLLTYYFDKIESIDGEKVTLPSKQRIQKKDYSYEEPKSEITYESEETYETKKGFESTSSHIKDEKVKKKYPETEKDTKGTESGGVIILFQFLIAILVIVSLWKVFSKAEQPGWACIIPIYNLYIMVKIADRPGWWLLLLLIPFVNFIVSIILYIDIAKHFDKGAGFGIGLVFLPFIFFPILAFSDAQYTG